MVQGGDPKGTGTAARVHDQGGVQQAEACAGHGGDGPVAGPGLGGQPVLHHVRPTPHLDKNYTVFGRVVSGMEHVDKIQKGDRMKSVKILEQA